MPIDSKPSKNEDEYFARKNAELVREMREKLDAERQAAERAEKAPKCPRCNVALAEQEMEHVKIDACPQCGGIWLDKGEIEQLGRVNRGRGVTGGVLSRLFGHD